MDIQAAIASVLEGNSLSTDETASVFRAIMTGQTTAAQIAGLVVALRMKGETVDELVGAASVMRELSVKVDLDKTNLVDTCGTGGDGANLFNVSTGAAFISAAAGARVAKHGNRSMSSSSGSSDVLEAAGVKLDISSEQVVRCVDELNVGFMFAPKHHSAMKYAAGPRKELGIRTLFNLLGPMTNPAAAPYQVLGVFDKKWVRPMAEVLGLLGSQHVMVVHAEDGLDEITVQGLTYVAELKQGEVLEYTIQPEDFGMKRSSSLEPLVVHSPQESLALIKQALDNQDGPALDILCLNAGAAIYVSGIASSLSEGVIMAQDAVGGGLAKQKLADLVSLTSCMQ